MADKPLSYDEAKSLARHEDAEVRRELAARTDVKPEILYFLAEDPDTEVRRTLAENEATPHHADILLARDADAGVREGLAAKIARLGPELSADEKDKVRRMAYEALEVLAKDQVTRVRTVLSETLKDVADAPPEVIRQLAWDVEIVVSGPVLQFSPILTDEDLIDIIERGTAPGRLNAISNRAEVAESVSDSIVATADEDAISILLGNPQAQIREETLDRIIDQAVDVEPWHAPLVARPALSADAAVRLAKFVASNLIDQLSAREDLAPEAIDRVREAVSERLEGGGGDESDETPLEEALTKVKALKEQGELNAAALTSALGNGQTMTVIAALALLTDVPPANVQKAVAKRDAKGLLALVWKAGFDARMAERIQEDVAGIEGDAVMRRKKDGGFPLSEDDLEWQFEGVSAAL